MSHENVEIVRQAYAAPALLVDAPHVADDAEFDFSEIYHDQPVLKGVEEMRLFRESGPWGRSIRFEPERFFEIDGERVLALVRVTATGQGSLAQVDARVAHEFTLRNGLIVRFKVYSDGVAALEALGLHE